MHELPPKHGKVWIAANEPLATTTRDFLLSSGRDAELAEAWQYLRDSETQQAAIGNQQSAMGNPPILQSFTPSPTSGRLWEPNSFLLEVAAQLLPGRALDLACGTGRDAVALAAMGWDVVAVDHLDDALERGRDLAWRYLSENEAARIEWIQADLESGFQCSALSAQPFDLVTMFWYLNRELIRGTAEHLSRGGSLVIETFTTVHRERFGKLRREHLALSPGELAGLVEPLSIHHCGEDWHGDRHSARLWAKAPNLQ